MAPLSGGDDLGGILRPPEASWIGVGLCGKASDSESVGQGVGPPTLQRRRADPDLTGHALQR
jgi:hypothetical protein